MHPFEDLSVPPDGLGLHWFGQSSFGLRHADGTIVQSDPYYPRVRPGGAASSTPRPPLMEESLRTDWVLLTHDHGDHTCMESIDRIRGAFPEVRFAGPPESCERLRLGGVSSRPRDGADRGGLGGSRPLHRPRRVGQAARRRSARRHRAARRAAPRIRHRRRRRAGPISREIRSTTSPTTRSCWPRSADLEPHVGLLDQPSERRGVPLLRRMRPDRRRPRPAHRRARPLRLLRRPRLRSAREWAGHLPGGVDPLIIPYNQSRVYTL